MISHTAQPLSQPERQQEVKRQFLHAWTAYEDHGWMSDSLLPLSGNRKNQCCGWSATLVDALDTLYIMGLDEEFKEALNATLSINFAHHVQNCTVNLFESTIRYLGGMLAAYDLSQDPRIVPKLVELGDVLHSAFDTWNGMPCSLCHLASKSGGEAFAPNNDVAMADVGSLYLEFGRLSQITGDQKYMNSVIFLTELFQRTQNDSSIPGLWPERVDSTSINGTDVVPAGFATSSYAYSLGALSDSSYEYLLKGHMFMGALTDSYADMWHKAARQIRRFMLFRAYMPDSSTNHTWTTPTTAQPDILFSGIATRFPDAENVLLEPRTQHLACFAGGMFAMASRVFSEPSDLAIGEALTNGCVWASQTSPIGIMPETFTALPCDLDASEQCAWNQSYWDEQRVLPSNYLNNDCESSSHFPAGWLQVMDPRYLLRPEAIESVFIMYRVTGNAYWRDVGWDMFQTIIQHTRTPYGHAALHTVIAKVDAARYDRGKPVVKPVAAQMDDMESFWFAETLKYFYLLFSDPALLSLDD